MLFLLGIVSLFAGLLAYSLQVALGCLVVTSFGLLVCNFGFCLADDLFCLECFPYVGV